MWMDDSYNVSIELVFFLKRLRNGVIKKEIT